MIYRVTWAAYIRVGYKDVMTAVSREYVAYVLDQLAALREVTSRRFFGGIGLTSAATQFAMLMGSTLYFVVDDTTRPKYEKMGSGCFSYKSKKGRVDVKKYYAVPADMIEDQERLVALARESIRIASYGQQGPTNRSTRSRVKRAPG